MSRYPIPSMNYLIWEFKLVLNSDLYKNMNGIWIDMSDDEAYVENAVKNGETMKVVGIIQPKEKALS